MSGQVAPLPMPPDADVEVTVKIHTPLNISQHVARQKVNVQIALHCGQSFTVDSAELHVSERVSWRVPVWVTHPTKGKLGCSGDIHVDAQTGEVLCTLERLKLLKAAANGVLQSSGDLRAVQEMLGHASIRSTQVYTHLDFQHLARAYDAAHPRAKKR